MSYTTLWQVPDGLWERIERILPKEKPKHAAHVMKRSHWRNCSDLFLSQKDCSYTSAVVI